ncbi:hypothetical protein CXB51_015580 [Gossypium anomalum]|uniref:CTLH domain-containing protein n=1 Tax=Gossypium anomalum TaxID=47600 RepID=A0A8J5Z124_9ROSI|nr:hypothetical protein CXB51_015580 [Gossypium anomalum]
MNKLVMNFLVTEGYAEAVAKFRMETGTEPDMDVAMIMDRMAVKKAVQCGNIEDAIEKVNDLNPEILDTNPELFFHLQQQILIELIRNEKIEEALEFAQEELAPRGEENRLKTANEVNAAILTSQSHEKGLHTIGNICSLSWEIVHPKLHSLLKMLIWAQNQLDEKATYPQIKDFSKATLENPAV